MSFNSLFGLGSHSPDASLEGWWPLQETSGSTANDESGNNRNGTITGATLDQAGPTNWLPKAFGFDGTDDDVNLGTVIPAAIRTANKFTIGAWVRPGSLAADQSIIGQWKSGDFQFLLWLDVDDGGIGYAAAVASGISSGFTLTGVDSANATLNDWHLVTATWDGTTLHTYKNGVLASSATGAQSIRAGTSPLYLGWAGEDGNRRLTGRLSGAFAFSADKSAAVNVEINNGPEPINSVAPAVSGAETVGETLTSTTGTWGLDAPFASGSNGTITYAYQWTRSDDAIGTGEADISGATSSTYTLVAADEGKFLRCRVRASNDGGFDADADTNSGFTGAIAAEVDIQLRRRRRSNTLMGGGFI